MRESLWLATAAAVVLGLVAGGCGGETSAEPKAAAPKEEQTTGPRHVEITIDGSPGAQTVGILMAKRLGYFAERGLEVDIFRPGSPSRPVEYVAGEFVDLSISHEPELVLTREEGGVPIVAVGSLISRPTAALIWLDKSKIGDIADLRGKTIATPGIPYQEQLLRAVLARAGLTLADVDVKNVGYETVPALLRGRADAIFGSWNLDAAELRARGAAPVVARLTDLGIPAFDELVVIARSDRASQDPETIRDFMAATARGTAAALAHPEAAVEAIEHNVESDRSVSRKLMRTEVKATLPLLSRSNHLSRAQAERLSSWMHETGLVRRRVPAPDFVTNRYLDVGNKLEQ